MGGFVDRSWSRFRTACRSASIVSGKTRTDVEPQARCEAQGEHCRRRNGRDAGEVPAALARGLQVPNSALDARRVRPALQSVLACRWVQRRAGQTNADEAAAGRRRAADDRDARPRPFAGYGAPCALCSTTSAQRRHARRPSKPQRRGSCAAATTPTARNAGPISGRGPTPAGSHERRAWRAVVRRCAGDRMPARRAARALLG